MLGDYNVFVFFLLLAFASAGIAGYVTRQNIPIWYDRIKKPTFNPPKWIFGPVWTTLYIMMSYAAFLVWREVKDGEGIRALPLQLYFVQLFFNFWWSILFFGFHLILVSFVEMLLLWVFIFATMIYFFKFSIVAGLLLLPYLLWVSFASFLTFHVWQLNEAPAAVAAAAEAKKKNKSSKK